jgi:urate oxidase
MTELREDRYGKSDIRLVKVVRDGARHTVRDLTVSVALEGEFERSFTDGDNSSLVATDTMKNTVYALAPGSLTGPLEAFGLVLARHFAGLPHVRHATVTLREHAWRRIHHDGTDADDAFVRAGDYVRVARVTAGADGERIESGVEDLVVMKTTKSAFERFQRDQYTTLRDTDDRILATRLTANWRYGDTDIDHDGVWSGALDTLLGEFAAHHSASAQESIWLVARAMLDRHGELEEVRMSIPNLHHWLVDLSPFGQANDNEIFVATTEPYGLIEATVRRTSGSGAPAS